MYDLIIIGGGPAGLAAAAYALRQHLNVLLIGDQVGGRVGWRLDVPWLENQHSLAGEDLVRALKAEVHLRHLARVLDRAVAVETFNEFYRVQTAAGVFETRTLLIATGAYPKRLQAPGEETFYLRGLSYSAITYASAMLDRVVAVIGDGPLALRSAAELVRAAARVYLVAADPACRQTPWGRRPGDGPVRRTARRGCREGDPRGPRGAHRDAREAPHRTRPLAPVGLRRPSRERGLRRLPFAPAHAGAKGPGGRLRGRVIHHRTRNCLLYTSPSPRDRTRSRMTSSA